MEECAQCRSVFADVGEIHAKWLPEHPDFEITRNRESDQNLRRAILRRVSKEGAHLSKAAENAGRLPEASPQSLRLIPAFAAGAVAVLVVGIALIAVQRVWHRPPRAQASVGSSISVPSAVGPRQPAAAPSQEAAQLREAKATLEEALRASQAEQATLRQQLREQQHRSVSLTQDKVENASVIAELQRQLEVSRANSTATRLELAKLRSAEATSEAVTAAQQQEIVNLNEKLTQQSASIEGEHQLISAGSDIRDLIAARNLHIIDVYDTDSRGKTTRAFGRVFYTEGKSLVFYAYDLASGHPNAVNYAFYVWGKKDGDPRLLRNLGPFAKDDQGQRRWVLTITDPKILAEIDSVFVTLEPTQPKNAGRPSGKRLLSAFLGTPANHP